MQNQSLIEFLTLGIESKPIPMSKVSDLTTKEIFRKWLEKLQQESWQLELLISGFALYGIYASKDFIPELQLYADKVSSSFFLECFIYLLDIGWRIFFINLLVHVILRSLWIGAIGLRYVSGEIDYDSLDFSQIFTEYLREKVGDYDDFIEKLEVICSVLFSYTFLLFLFFLSAILFIAFGALPVTICEWLDIDWSESGVFLNMFWFYPYMAMGLLVFIDFISLGGIKRVKDKFISKLYMPIYRFFSTITLSFLYRPLIYNFIDDRYTRKLFFLSMPYIIMVTFGHNIFSSRDNPHVADFRSLRNTGLSVNYNNYDDLYQEHLDNGSKLFSSRKKLPAIRLDAYLQKKDLGTVFFKNLHYDKIALEEFHKVETYYEDGIRFSLFKKIKLKEDVNVKSIEKKYIPQFKELRAQRKSLNRKSHLSKNESKSIFQARVDSIDSAIKKLADIKYQEITDVRNQRKVDILEGYKKLFHFYIDDKSYQDSLTCYYSLHSNNMEKGLLCHFPTKSLTTGIHEIKFERLTQYIRHKNEADSTTYLIPFIKE